MVLLTFYLPVAVGSCGGGARGHDLAGGNPDVNWPSLLGFTSRQAGRGFYILCLVFAAFTLLFVLTHIFRPGSLRRSKKIPWLFAIAGSLSLFSITDFFAISLVYTVDLCQKWSGAGEVGTSLVLGVLGTFLLASGARSEFLRGQGWITWLFTIASLLAILFIADISASEFSTWSADHVQISAVWEEALSVVFFALAMLVIVSCLHLGAWRKRGFLAWLMTAAGSASVVLVLGFLFSALLPNRDTDKYSKVFSLFIPLFSLLSLALWYRFGLSWNPDRQAHWPKVRVGLLFFYLPAAIFDCVIFAVDGTYWGIVPFLIGSNLIFLGYLQLENERRRLFMKEAVAPEIAPGFTLKAS